MTLKSELKSEYCKRIWNNCQLINYFNGFDTIYKGNKEKEGGCKLFHSIFKKNKELFT